MFERWCRAALVRADFALEKSHESSSVLGTGGFAMLGSSFRPRVAAA
jgi:hypothetical protein